MWISLWNICRTLIKRVALAFIESTIISQYELLEVERWTIDLQEARVIVPTQLNEPIEQLIHSKSRRRAARPIFDLRRRTLVSGIIHATREAEVISLLIIL